MEIFSERWIDALGNFRRQNPVLVKVFALEIRDMLAKAMCIGAVKQIGLGFNQEVVTMGNVTDIESNVGRNYRWLCLVLVESCLFQRAQTVYSCFPF